MSLITNVRKAIITAINSKGGSLTQSATLWQCVSAISALSAGSGNTTAVPGYFVNTNGTITFQPAAGGTASAVSSIYLPDTGQDEPEYSGKPVAYYKCASVNTTAKTWTGYLATIDSTTGVWTFASTATTGLTYTSVEPIIGNSYSADALVRCELFTGIPVNGLVFYAPLKENRQGTATEQSLVTQNTVTYSTVSNVPCAYFSGNSCIYSGDDDSFAVGNTGTLSIWFKTNSSGTMCLCNIGFAGMDYLYKDFNIYLRDNKISVGNNGAQVVGDTTIDSAWHHCAVTVDDGTWTTYVDGDVYKTGALTLDCTSIFISIGAIMTTSFEREEPLTGYLASVRVYNRALSASEIDVLASEFTPTNA